MRANFRNRDGMTINVERRGYLALLAKKYRDGVDPVGEPVAKQNANGACAAKFRAKDYAWLRAKGGTTNTPLHTHEEGICQQNCGRMRDLCSLEAAAPCRYHHDCATLFGQQEARNNGLRALAEGSRSAVF